MSLPAQRLMSMDAYRGFVMLLMAAEALRWHEVVEKFPGNAFWSFIGFHTSHVAWGGCSLHDLIQPSFSFLVGTALAFSVASRQARGQGPRALWVHALIRSVVLVLLGVFLRSMDAKQTYWTFEDTLSQIGLGYPLLFAVAWLSERKQWMIFGALLLAYWAWFAMYVPPADWSAAAAGVPRGWTHQFTGFAAHWNHNAHPAWAFDRWFLNLFSREKPFIGSPGSYSTLSFLPTLATMMLGLMAGRWLRKDARTVKPFIIAGVISLAAGTLLDVTGLCPSVKKIWTPAWVGVSGGWCFLLLAAFHFVIELRGWRTWAFPLVVIGMNSLLMYVLCWTCESFVRQSFAIHMGEHWAAFAGALSPLVEGTAVLGVFWALLWWLYRRGVSVRV